MTKLEIGNLERNSTFTNLDVRILNYIDKNWGLSVPFVTMSAFAFSFTKLLQLLEVVIWT